MITELSCDIIFIAIVMGLGLWLETIGGKYDFWDSYFTWLPLGLSGTTIVLLDRLIA